MLRTRKLGARPEVVTRLGRMQPVRGTGLGPAAPRRFARSAELMRPSPVGLSALRDKTAWRWARAAMLENFRRDPPAPTASTCASRDERFRFVRSG